MINDTPEDQMEDGSWGSSSHVSPKISPVPGRGGPEPKS